MELPESWSASGFSETVSPPRLVLASYPVSRAEVEGDCGGQAAVRRLPRDGAYVVLIDYGSAADLDVSTRNGFTDRLPVELGDGQLAEFECFGRSYAFHVLLEGRGLQAHLGFGPAAGSEIREQALRIVNSIRILQKS